MSKYYPSDAPITRVPSRRRGARRKRILKQVERPDETRFDWYAVQTPPQKESTLAQILQIKGVGVFLPKERVLRGVNKFTRRRRFRELAIIKGIVFIAMPDGHSPNWAKLFELNLLHRLLCDMDGKPYKFSDDELRRLSDRLGVKAPVLPNYARYMRTGQEFGVNDSVDIMDGPFQGRIAKVVAITDDEAEVLMSLLGKEHAVRVPINFIEPAA